MLQIAGTLRATGTDESGAENQQQPGGWAYYETKSAL